MDTKRNRRIRGWTLATPAFSVLTLLASFTAFAQAPADSSSASTPALTVERVSAEDFGALPFLHSPQLSPSGKRAAAKAYVKGGLRLAIIDLDGKTKVSAAIPIPDKRDLLWHRWAGDNRLLMSLGKSERIRGEDVYVSRLMMIDVTTFDVHFIGKKSEGPEGDDVIYIDPNGEHLLLNIQETVFDYPSVWRVNLETIAMKRVVRARERVWNWYADTAGVVRAGVGISGPRWWVVYRKDEDDGFKTVIKRKAGEEAAYGDIDGFYLRPGTDKGYVIANKPTGRFGLYHYDFVEDALGEPIFEHPHVDLSDVSQSEQGDIDAVYFTDDRSRIEWFDPNMKTIQSAIDQAVPNQLNRVVSYSRDKQRMIVWTGGASDPGRYFVFDAASGIMRLLAKPYDRINAKTLVDMQSTTYRARDGLEIPAYLTMPLGRGNKSLPLVVMPHGGPFARDSWGYDRDVQFLANRGYVVLQPNFRGSTGYGKAYVEKGEGQFGRGMQDDIDDGVKWLVEQGTVDPKRVCIMGGSFGGYAAMWAAARNPDIYRCAISFAGISDVEAMLRYDRKLFRATRYYRDWRETIQGEKDFDLATVSPLRAVDRISIPLLIAHGDLDENVPPSQSEKLHDALTKANKPHEFVMYEGEGHGFQDPANATDYLKRVEAFLKKYNPADEIVASKQ